MSFSRREHNSPRQTGEASVRMGAGFQEGTERNCSWGPGDGASLGPPVPITPAGSQPSLPDLLPRPLHPSAAATTTNYFSPATCTRSPTPATARVGAAPLRRAPPPEPRRLEAPRRPPRAAASSRSRTDSTLRRKSGRSTPAPTASAPGPSGAQSSFGAFRSAMRRTRVICLSLCRASGDFTPSAGCLRSGATVFAQLVYP